MVFQRFNLFPHMAALDNIMEAPIHVRGMAHDEAMVMGFPSRLTLSQLGSPTIRASNTARRSSEATRALASRPGGPVRSHILLG